MSRDRERKPSRLQKLYCTRHLFGGKNVGVQPESPDAFSQRQPMHLDEDDAKMVLPLEALLDRDLYEMVVMGENRGLQRCSAPEMLLVGGPQQSLFESRRCGNASPTKALDNSNIYILIDIEL